MPLPDRITERQKHCQKSFGKLVHVDILQPSIIQVNSKRLPNIFVSAICVIIDITTATTKALIRTTINIITECMGIDIIIQVQDVQNIMAMPHIDMERDIRDTTDTPIIKTAHQEHHLNN
jgi:hypothetical protein